MLRVVMHRELIISITCKNQVVIKSDRPLKLEDFLSKTSVVDNELLMIL